MTLNLKLCWKVFHRLPDSAPEYVVGGTTDLFEVRTGKSILRDVGGNIESSFFPLVLEPKSPVFSKLLSTARQFGLRGSKLLFEGELPAAFAFTEGVLSCRFGLHLYGKHACISVDCQPFSASENIDLRKIQDLKSFPALQAMVRRLMELLTTRANKSLPVPGDFKVYPCLQIAAAPDARQFAETELAAIVTRHSRIRKSAADAVLAKNLDHQVDGTTTLVDRQGVLSYIPSSAHADEIDGSNRRFRSCVAMIELAAAGQRLLNDQVSVPLATVEALRSLIFHPKLTIPNSTSAQRAWSLFSSEFNLVEAYSNCQRKTTTADSTTNEILAPVTLVTDEISENHRVTEVPSIISGIRILCLAAATVELSTVSERLTELYGEGEIFELDDGHEFALRFWDREKSVTWYVVPLSFQGQVDAAVGVKTLCNFLKPTLALMVGMCMSMPGKGLPAGTVVIPNEVTVFDHERLTTEGVQHRPHGDRVDNGLFKLARLVASTRKFQFKVVTDKGLASATSKVENVNSDLVRFIETSFPDAAAFDMEGWGFYRAGSGQLCLWIKAVADAGEPQGVSHAGQQEKLNKQAEVTKNAVNFSVALVESFIKVRKI